MTLTFPRALILLDGAFAVCRLEPGASVPPWATAGPLASVTRTADEVSVVCAEAAVPPATRAELGWRAFRVAGTLDFGLVGVLAALTAPLAAAGVSVFAVSTFDTDYLLVRAADLDRASAALGASGWSVEAPAVADADRDQSRR